MLDGFEESGAVQVQPLKSQDENHVNKSLLLNGFDERSAVQVQPLKSQDENHVNISLLLDGFDDRGAVQVQPPDIATLEKYLNILVVGVVLMIGALFKCNLQILQRSRKI